VEVIVCADIGADRRRSDGAVCDDPEDDRRRDVSGDGRAAATGEFRAAADDVRRHGMSDLDAVDRALLRELQQDARRSNRDLAAAVHVSPSTSSERVRALRGGGVVRGYHADVSLPALGRHVQALTAVTIRPPTRRNIEAFRNWVGTLPELIGVFVVSGGSDFLLHVAVPDTDALYAFVIDRLTGRPEVADVNTSIVYEHIRRTVLEPI
jgi:DNA-binding Lrp family transcriptional regulator